MRNIQTVILVHPQALMYFLPTSNRPHKVKQHQCSHCDKDFDLFPGYLLSEDKRHPLNVLICATCGDLNEVVDRKQPCSCATCTAPLRPDGPAKRSHCACPHCGEIATYPAPETGPPRHFS